MLDHFIASTNAVLICSCQRTLGISGIAGSADCQLPEALCAPAHDRTRRWGLPSGGVRARVTPSQVIDAKGLDRNLGTAEERTGI